MKGASIVSFSCILEAKSTSENRKASDQSSRKGFDCKLSNSLCLPISPSLLPLSTQPSILPPLLPSAFPSSPSPIHSFLYLSCLYSTPPPFILSSFFASLHIKVFMPHKVKKTHPTKWWQGWKRNNKQIRREKMKMATSVKIRRDTWVDHKVVARHRIFLWVSWQPKRIGASYQKGGDQEGENLLVSSGAECCDSCYYPCRCHFYWQKPQVITVSCRAGSSTYSKGRSWESEKQGVCHLARRRPHGALAAALCEIEATRFFIFCWGHWQ